MKISLFRNNTNCESREITNFKELASLVCSSQHFAWSPGIFKNNYRNLDNFVSMDVIALDFDSGMTLEEAGLVFSDYAHIIGTSRSHQKPKDSKPACDRFRVILQLERPITNDDDYKATFNELIRNFPAADRACSDASRFFYPCTGLHACSAAGKQISVITAPPRPIKSSANTIDPEHRGKLARATMEFISIGVKTNRTQSAFKAAKDFQEQGFNQAEAEEALLKSPNVDEPGFSAKELLRIINSAYKREPKYEPRELHDYGIKEPWNNLQGMEHDATTNKMDCMAQGRLAIGENVNKSLSSGQNMGSLTSIQLFDEAVAHLANPLANKGVSTGWKEIDDLLGGLRQAELGILQAKPKSGKTSLVVNMIANLTRQGHKVGFASLEMVPAKQVEPDLYSLLLKKDIRGEGCLTDEDKHRIVGMLNEGRGITYFKRDKRPTSEDICDWARRLYHEQGIEFFFFDHFHKLVPDESSVSSVAKTITNLTGLKYECPRMSQVLIVQPTKEQRTREGLIERVGSQSLRGGAVIFDECDWLINMHTQYRSHKTTETTWGPRKQELMLEYPQDIRELEFEAIRAKPWSKNMKKKIYMKYNEATTEMTPFKWIAPPPEYIEMEEKEGNYRRPQGASVPSDWAKNTFRNKRI